MIRINWKHFVEWTNTPLGRCCCGGIGGALGGLLSVWIFGTYVTAIAAGAFGGSLGGWMGRSRASGVPMWR